MKVRHARNDSFWSRRRISRKRRGFPESQSLRLEVLEPRQMLSGLFSTDQLSWTLGGRAAAVADVPAVLPEPCGDPVVSGLVVSDMVSTYLAEDFDSHVFEVLAKAEPDEFFNGIGQPYIPLGQQGPGDVGVPKVNHDYVWGMTQSGEHIWFASAGNVGLGFGGGRGPRENSISVAEGSESQFPLIPDSLRDYIGDWRPPKIHRYNMVTGVYEEITPDDPLIEKTLGFRSAGATDQVVLFAGPSVYFAGMNVFAYNAQTGEYLGSEQILEYTNVRQWVNVDGQLYAGVSRTLPTTWSGEGAVIRFKGSVRNPFRFVEVGRLDLEGANIAVHDGRLFVSTWPVWVGSLMWQLGYRSEELPGVWMSPELGRRGLSRLDAGRWEKVWDTGQLEVDPVVAGSYGMGALRSFDGYLYFGTLNPPTSPLVFVEQYPEAGIDPMDPNSPVAREATLLRGRNFDRPAQREVELLFGDDQLWKYTPPGQDPVAEPGHFDLVPNKMGPARFGQSGFRSGPFDPNLATPGTIAYAYTMAVYDGHLYLGTEDFAMKMFGDAYVAANGDVDVAEAILASAGMPGVKLGADLWLFPPGNAEPVVLTRHGGTNPLNFGFRTMESTAYGLFIGTSSASNLLTDPDSPLKAGGWELIKVVKEEASASLLVGSTLARRQPGDRRDHGVLCDAAMEKLLKDGDHWARLACLDLDLLHRLAGFDRFTGTSAKSDHGKSIAHRVSDLYWLADE